MHLTEAEMLANHYQINMELFQYLIETILSFLNVFVLAFGPGNWGSNLTWAKLFFWQYFSNESYFYFKYYDILSLFYITPFSKQSVYMIWGKGGHF